MGRGNSGGARIGRAVGGVTSAAFRERVRPTVGSVAIPVLGGLLRTGFPIVVTRTGSQVAGTAVNARAGTLGARENFYPRGTRFLVYPNALTGNSYDDSIAVNDWLRPYLGIKPRRSQ